MQEGRAARHRPAMCDRREVTGGILHSGACSRPGSTEMRQHPPRQRVRDHDEFHLEVVTHDCRRSGNAPAAKFSCRIRSPLKAMSRSAGINCAISDLSPITAPKPDDVFIGRPYRSCRQLPPSSGPQRLPCPSSTRLSCRPSGRHLRQKPTRCLTYFRCSAHRR